MTEIQQLRADISTLEAAEAVFARKYGQAYLRYNVELEKMNKQLAKLEEEAADPWREARDSVNVYIVSNHGSIQLLAKYARHLKAQVVELEEEVRCERIDGGKVHADLKARI